MKQLLKISSLGVLTLLTGLGLSACKQEATTDAPSISKESAAQTEVKKEIIIGTTPGDFGDMVKDSITGILEKKGYKVTLKEFSDYVTPNKALAEGDIDVNVFQHKPYLDTFAADNKLELTPVFQVPTGPLGIYSGRLKTLD